MTISIAKTTLYRISPTKFSPWLAHNNKLPFYHYYILKNPNSLLKLGLDFQYEFFVFNKKHNSGQPVLLLSNSKRNLGNYPQQEQSSSDNWHVNINSNSYLGLAEALKDMSRLLKSPPHLSLSDDTLNLFYCLANADDNFDKSRLVNTVQVIHEIHVLYYHGKLMRNCNDRTLCFSESRNPH